MDRANRTTFTPHISKAQSARLYKRWTKAVDMARGWMDPVDGE